MPDGKTHSLIASTTALVVTGAVLYLAPPLPVAAGLVMGAWLELIVDPDLDLEAVTSESEQKVLRLNRTLGVLWMDYWWFYGKAFAHRSRHSHSWPQGTLWRFTWAFWLSILVSMLAFDLVTFLGFWGSLFAGLSLGDWSHLIADRLWTGARKAGLR